MTARIVGVDPRLDGIALYAVAGVVENVSLEAARRAGDRVLSRAGGALFSGVK